MTDSTISPQLVEDVLKIADWIYANITDESDVLVPFRLYGWLILRMEKHTEIYYSPPSVQRDLGDVVGAIQPRGAPRLSYARDVDIYVPGSRFSLIESADDLRQTYLGIYVVWWAPGQLTLLYGGLPTSFEMVFKSGDLAVYSFLA